MTSPRVGLPIKFSHKADLIAALEARRKWCERTDKKRLAEHEKQEKAYLASFQKACREAATWTYEQAKENSFEVRPPRKRDDYYWGERPSCPASRAVQLDAILARLALTSQEQFTLNEGDPMHYLLTADDDVDAEMC